MGYLSGMTIVKCSLAAGLAVLMSVGTGCAPGAGNSGVAVEPPDSSGGNRNGTVATPATGSAPDLKSSAPIAKGTERTDPARPTDAAPSPQQPPQAGANGQTPRTGGFGRGGMMFLLNNDQVKKELGITEDQVKRLAAVMPERGAGGAPGAGAPDTSPEERQKQREEMQKKIEAILTDQQKSRIQQIQYQMQGPRVFTSPEVSKELGITAEQTRKLEAIVPPRGQGRQGGPAGPAAGAPRSGGPGTGAPEAGGPGAGGPGAGAPRGGQQMSPEDRQKQREEQMKKSLEVLTPAQKAKWESMKGKPFELKFQPRGGNGGGGPGRISGGGSGGSGSLSGA